MTLSSMRSDVARVGCVVASFFSVMSTKSDESSMFESKSVLEFATLLRAYLQSFKSSCSFVVVSVLALMTLLEITGIEGMTLLMIWMRVKFDPLKFEVNVLQQHFNISNFSSFCVEIMNVFCIVPTEGGVQHNSMLSFG